MRLTDLLARSLPVRALIGSPEVEIAGIAYHSGTVRPGDLFGAIRGFVDDGHRYAMDAVLRKSSDTRSRVGGVEPGVTPEMVLSGVAPSCASAPASSLNGWTAEAGSRRYGAPWACFTLV